MKNKNIFSFSFRNPIVLIAAGLAVMKVTNQLASLT